MNKIIIGTAVHGQHGVQTMLHSTSYPNTGQIKSVAIFSDIVVWLCWVCCAFVFVSVCLCVCVFVCAYMQGRRVCVREVCVREREGV